MHNFGLEIEKWKNSQKSREELKTNFDNKLIGSRLQIIDY